MNYLHEPGNFVNSLNSISSSLDNLKAQPQYQPLSSLQKPDQIDNTTLQHGALLQQMTYDLQQQHFSGIDKNENSFTQTNMLGYQSNYNSYNQITNQLYSNNLYNSYSLSSYHPGVYQNQITTQNQTGKIKAKLPF